MHTPVVAGRGGRVLGLSNVIPTIPCTDVDRAREFYADKLKLRPLEVDDPAGGMYFEAGAGRQIYIYPRPETHAEHTLAAFEVEDIAAAVRDLRKAGVKFEDYDIPEMGIKTQDGIATMGDIKTAWFKDPDGNILAVEEKT